MDIMEVLQYLPHRYPFLLIDRAFPNAIRFGARAIRFSLDELGETIPQLRHSEAPRTVGKLTAALRFDAIEEILGADVQAYLGDIRQQCQRLHRAIYDACIAYPIESVLTGQSSLQAAQ